jgi:hypothetical protein
LRDGAAFVAEGACRRRDELGYGITAGSKNKPYGGPVVAVFNYSFLVFWQMNSTGALIGLFGTLVCLFGLTMGVLMVVSPHRVIALGLWVGRLMGFKNAGIRWDGSGRREWQVAGFLLAGTSLFMLVIAFQTLLNALRSTNVAGLQTAIRHPGSEWYSFVGNLVLFFIGLYTVIRARALFLAMQVRSEFVNAHRGLQPIGILIFRLVGLVWIVGAAITIARWITRSL